MDLVSLTTTCEIAQAVAAQGEQMVKYWMHNNMITINGQKMGKSLNNFITLEQFLYWQPRNVATGLLAYDHSASLFYLRTIAEL